MKKIWNHTKSWYLGLPWWGKALGWVAFIGVLILLVLLIFMPPAVKPILKMLGEVDDLKDGQHNENMENLQDEGKEIEKAIKEKKKEIAKKVNQAGEIDKETLERRAAISNATTMEELEELQERFGL